MKRSVLTRDAVVLVPLMILLLGIATLSGQQETGAVADPAEGEEGVEVLARGPLLEAFAEEVNQDPPGRDRCFQGSARADHRGTAGVQARRGGCNLDSWLLGLG